MSSLLISLTTSSPSRSIRRRRQRGRIQPVLRDKEYEGQRLTLNFQDIETRAVLQLLAETSGKNIVVSDTVQGNVTLRLRNVPWDQALDIVMTTKGLDMRQNGNVIMVAPAEEIAARETADLEAQLAISELEPMYSEFLQVNYAKASDLAASDYGVAAAARCCLNAAASALTIARIRCWFRTRQNVCRMFVAWFARSTCRSSRYSSSHALLSSTMTSAATSVYALVLPRFNESNGDLTTILVQARVQTR